MRCSLFTDQQQEVCELSKNIDIGFLLAAV